MVEQDYDDFCNEAHDLEASVEAFFANLSEDQLDQLSGFVRSEIDASKGRLRPGYSFLAAMLGEEVAHRKRVSSKAFERAILTFTSELVDASDHLISALTKMPDEEWSRASEIICTWIERGCANADAYGRVLERVIHERGRLAAANATRLEIPF